MSIPVTSASGTVQPIVPQSDGRIAQIFLQALQQGHAARIDQAQVELAQSKFQLQSQISLDELEMERERHDLQMGIQTQHRDLMSKSQALRAKVMEKQYSNTLRDLEFGQKAKSGYFSIKADLPEGPMPTRSGETKKLSTHASSDSPDGRALEATFEDMGSTYVDHDPSEGTLFPSGSYEEASAGLDNFGFGTSF